MNEPSIRMRPIEREDLIFLRDLANDPVVRANVVEWDWPYSLAGQIRWFESGLDTGTTRRFIVESLDGEPLGITGLWDINWHNRTAMVGIKLGGVTSARGRGLGAETMRITMDFAFNDVGLNRLYAGILEGNAASLGAFVGNSGWIEEGRLRSHIWKNGDFVDLIQVGILRSEYETFVNAIETT